jgi:predicted nucleotidyltransferase component of viral defense system
MSYENILYPLQDKVLSLIDSLGTPFYLTGGTALSRFHFKHRYSDDLDFFVNNDPKFHDYVKSIIQLLAGHGLKYVVEIRDESFYRLTVEDTLKIDFVNDVPAYHGEVELRTSGPYSKIDNPMNILANKVTAFSDRDEPKDISDIWIISKKLPIDWKTIFTAADSKAAGINAPVIAKKIEEYNLAGLGRIKWINRPTDEEFKNDMAKVVDGILRIR